MEAHSCNPRYFGGKVMMIAVQGWSGKKQEILSKNKAKGFQDGG
jgi:hypothetical protein